LEGLDSLDETIKIAVSLSGMPRNFEQCYENTLEFFNIDNAQVDFFIHAWSNEWYPSRVKSKTPLLNNPLRSAGFAVLKSDEFPSVLVELGFVTNEFDRKNLRSGNCLQTISSQFVSAINEYFK
jgi:hypothetical protein